MIGAKASIVLTLMAGTPGLLSALELEAGTVDAWEAYLHDVDIRMQARLDGQQPFLWTDESADRTLRVRRGEVVVAPLVEGGIRSVPKGLIHHWIGAAFISGA